MSTASRRVVVKIGSALLTTAQGQFDAQTFDALAFEIADLVGQGHALVVVSSGAVSLGWAPLGLHQRPRQLALKQAAAAAGQSHLMAAYIQTFARCQREAAQVLLIHADLADRRRYLNARRALAVLLERGLIPVVNENDTVSVDELKVGDNDTLAAEVAGLIDADVLILLSTVDALYDRDPAKPGAQKIARVEQIDAALRSAAGSASLHGTGGMVTKLRAAESAAVHGATTVLASGRLPRVLSRILAGEDLGTRFELAGHRRQPARKRWIGQTLRSRGVLVIDDGACRALRERQSSLLPVGVTEVRGDFVRGDQVCIEDAAGRVVARGLVAYDASEVGRILRKQTGEIEAILGYCFGDEVVHRDDLVVEDGAISATDRGRGGVL